MLKAIQTLPDQLAWGWSAADDAVRALEGRSFEDVLICGMGGSAFPGELLRLALGEQVKRVEVFRGYAPPVGSLTSTTLVVASSFSGNTEETLSAFEASRESDATVIGMTGGGELEVRAKAHGMPLVILPRPWADFQPRAATGMFLGALSRLVSASGIRRDLQGQLHALELFLRGYQPEAGLLDESVNAVQGRVPLICGCTARFSAVAQVAKIKLNENAKMAAFWNYLPEMNHNELEGFTSSSDLFSVFLLEAPEMGEAMRSRMNATARILRDRGVPVVVIPSWDERSWPHAFGQLLFFDHLSLRLAEANGVDANPVPTIEAFKRLL